MIPINNYNYQAYKVISYKDIKTFVIDIASHKAIIWIETKQRHYNPLAYPTDIDPIGWKACLLLIEVEFRPLTNYEFIRLWGIYHFVIAKTSIALFDDS